MLLDKKRLQSLMEKHDLDAVVASTPANVLYTTDFYSRDHWEGYYVSQMFVILPRTDEPAIVTPKVLGLEKSWIKDLHFYGRTELGTFTSDKKPLVAFHEVPAAEDAIAALVRVLKSRRLEAGRIGFDHLGMNLHDKLRGDLPDAKLSEAEWFFEELRRVKSEDEITRLKETIRTTEVALEAGISAIRQGITDREIRHVVNAALMREDAISMTTLARGGPMTTPTRIIENGDSIWFDVVAMKCGYRSDIGRTAVLGKASARFEKYYDATFRGQEEALKSLRAGVRVCDIFDVAVKTVMREGIGHYKRQAIGHGIGLGFDLPEIGPQDKTMLEEGMVLCVETPYREIGFGGMMLEDIVVVKRNGFDFLTSINRDLYRV